MNQELDTRTKISIWQQKVNDGTITEEELFEAVRAVRADRLAAQELGTKRRAAKGPMKTGDQLLDELDSLE